LFLLPSDCSTAASIFAKLGFQKLNLSLHFRELLVEQSILSEISFQREKGHGAAKW
jgi:hypothetical protein